MVISTGSSLTKFLASSNLFGPPSYTYILPFWPLMETQAHNQIYGYGQLGITGYKDAHPPQVLRTEDKTLLDVLNSLADLLAFPANEPPRPSNGLLLCAN